MELGEEELKKKTNQKKPFFLYSESSNLCDYLQGRRRNHHPVPYKARDWAWLHVSILQYALEFEAIDSTFPCSNQYLILLSRTEILQVWVW